MYYAIGHCEIKDLLQNCKSQFKTRYGFGVRDKRSIVLYLICFSGCWILQQNRPLNSQVVADFLQKFNLKKTAIQKALDSLADSGRITFKEYGKQKIYLARQDQFQIPNTEELNQMKEENAKLQELLDERKKENSQLEGGIFFLNRLNCYLNGFLVLR